MEMNIFNFGARTGLVHLARTVLDVKGHRRYWEDELCEQVLPKIDGELDNTPGKGRIERLTHDDYRYNNITISPSNKSVSFHMLLTQTHGYFQTDGIRFKQGE